MIPDAVHANLACEMTLGVALLIIIALPIPQDFLDRKKE